MAGGMQSHSDGISTPDPEEVPQIAICESAPGKWVFLESGNTDGWIASEDTVDVRS